MKSSIVTSIKGLAKVILTSYQSWADVCLMKDEKGMYLLGFPHKSFPSSNNDEVIIRFSNIGNWNINSVTTGLSEQGISSFKGEIRKF